MRDLVSTSLGGSIDDGAGLVAKLFTFIGGGGSESGGDHGADFHTEAACADDLIGGGLPEDNEVSPSPPLILEVLLTVEELSCCHSRFPEPIFLRSSGLLLITLSEDNG